MFRKLLLLLCLVYGFTAFSQSIGKSVILIDTDTNEPIADATVFIVKTKQSLLSNAEGKVSFVLNGASNIQITHASYVSLTIRSTALKASESMIFLKSSVNNLDEIILTKEHPQKILKELVENSISKLTIPARLKVYCREFFKLNGAYSYYNDGLLNFQLSGNNKSLKSNILVEQNRSFGVVDDNIGPDALGYNLNNIIENYYSFKYLNPLLETNAKKDYEFLIKAYAKNNDYYLMTATPNINGKDLRDDFTIIYDHKKKIIIEAGSYVSPLTVANMKDKTAIGSKNIYKSLFKTIYRLDNSNYYLLSTKEEIGFERVDKNKRTNIEVRNYLVTNNFSNHNYTFKDSEVFKDKTLYNKKNSILTNYWENSGLDATSEELEVISKMEYR